jgi:hypothetical protein
MTELSLLGLSSSLRHASNSAAFLASTTAGRIRTPYLGINRKSELLAPWCGVRSPLCGTTSSAEIIEVVDVVRATSLGGAVAWPTR